MHKLKLLTITGILLMLISCACLLIVLPKESVVAEQEIDEKAVITDFAQDKLDDLVKTDTWSHTNSDGRTFSMRHEELGLEVDHWLGENLYKGTCDIENAFKLWEKSPTHKSVLDHRHTSDTVLMTVNDNPSSEVDECYAVYIAIEIN